MSSFYTKLKKIFPFRSAPNTLITFFGLAGTTYFVFRYNNDNQFEHAVIRESLRLLTQNTQVIEMIGYPINVVPGLLSSRASISERGSLYQFAVRGPRGKLNVSLSTESKSQEEIKNAILSKEYYIPDNSLKLILEDAKVQGGEKSLETIEIPNKQKFWKINFLSVDISPDYRIAVVKTTEKITKTDGENPNINEIQTKLRKMLFDVYNEENERKGNINLAKSEEEIEEIRKFRMKETYRKIGYVRFYLFGVAVLGVMLTYIFISKNKRKMIQGSEIQYMMQKIVGSNQYIKNKYGEHLKFIQSSRGSIVDKKADFEQDFFTNKGYGTIITEGVFDDKEKQWKIESIKVFSKNKKGEVSDLHKII